MMVHAKVACGISKLKGAAPKIEAQITYLRPTRSPIGPPSNVQIAVATRKINKYN